MNFYSLRSTYVKREEIKATTMNIHERRALREEGKKGFRTLKGFRTKDLGLLLSIIPVPCQCIDLALVSNSGMRRNLHLG